MLAYRNDPEFKQQCVEAAEQHMKLDMLVKGTYGTMNGSFTGCSVGCDVYDIKGEVYNACYHAITSEYFGWPEWVEHLRDAIFEGLPEPENSQFHVQLKKAIPVGMTDDQWDEVWLEITEKRLSRLADEQERSIGDKWGVVKAIRQVIHAFLLGSEKDRNAAESAARSAERSAEGAAWSTAAGAAWSAAWNAAESAAWSAERSAESAAWSAAWSTERSTERSAESAAWSAAASAARSAAASAAWSAARSAARSAAESAARSAAWSAAESAARSAAWQRERDNFLQAIEKHLTPAEAGMMKCETCGGTGNQWLMRSWFETDGYRREKCGICGGTGVSNYKHHDRDFVRRQSQIRTAK